MQELEDSGNPKVLPWPKFQEMFLKGHKQGEHVALVGPNGTGKTQVGLELCKIIGTRKGDDGRPSRVTVISTKPRDDTVSRMQKEGKPTGEWQTIKKWPPSYGQEHCVVWPRGGPPSGAARRHRTIFVPLIDTIYAEGGQTLYIPEAAYFERPLPNGLGMSGTMEQLWSTARSLKLTVISDTQRPRQVTRLMWSEPKWIFIFRVRDDDDLKRVAEMSGKKMDVWKVVPKLRGHEFMVIRAQDIDVPDANEIYVSRVDVTGNKGYNKSDEGAK
jgi:energy-coupling factor transporter ATP-binding protein EcfA2